MPQTRKRPPGIQLTRRTLLASAVGAAAVSLAASDARGQDARLVVDSPGRCTLVVATNYVHTLRATSEGTGTDLAVFPIDLALTGIEVPAGHTTILLGPRAVLPWWSRLGFVLGLGLLATALVIVRRS